MCGMIKMFNKDAMSNGMYSEELALVLFRCIGDLSKLQCKDSGKKDSIENGQSCVRNPNEAKKSLLNRATILDSYVGWTIASLVTFFTRDHREAHIVCSCYTVMCTFKCFITVCALSARCIIVHPQPQYHY